MSIQKITAYEKERIDTGALQIGDDWTGLFIRGDDCIMLLTILSRIKNRERLTVFEEPVIDIYLEEIINNVLKRKHDN